MSKRGFLSITVFAALVVATLVCATVFCVSAECAYAEKIPYVIDLSDVTVAVNDTSVAVYFTANPDEKIKYAFTWTTAEGEKTEISDLPYISGIENASTEGVKIKLFREEDETYSYAEASLSAVVKNTDAAIVKLPAGQKVEYNGYAQVFEGAVFMRNGEVAELKGAGLYVANIEYGTFTVSAAFTVEKTKVVVAPKNVSVKYGEIIPAEEVVVYGTVSDDEKKYIADNTVVSAVGLTEDSGVGTYILTAEYGGVNSDNYDVEERDGTYTVRNADFVGFTFDDVKVLYDGKPHKATVKYDESVWDKAVVVYTVGEVTEKGKYFCKATIKQDNYNELTLTAYLIIMDKTLQSNNVGNVVSISSEEGFDPTYTVSAVKNADESLSKKADLLCEENETTKDVVIGAYDIQLKDGDAVAYVPYGNYTIKIALDGVTDPSGVRLFTYTGGELKETEYTFTDGKFVFTANGTTGFVFIGKEKIAADNKSVIIYCAIFAVVLLFIVLAISQAFRDNGKKKRKWRKKHGRWA